MAIDWQKQPSRQRARQHRLLSAGHRAMASKNIVARNSPIPKVPRKTIAAKINRLMASASLGLIAWLTC